MPVPASAVYSPAALAAAHTAFRDLIDDGSGPGSLKIRSATDVLLAQIPLTYPCGAVNSGTGQLTLTPSGPGVSPAAGVAAYGEICDGDGLVYLSLPAQVGAAAVSGAVVLSMLSVAEGATLEALSILVG